ncbi:flagellar motor protein MotB [Yoonia sp. 208BN28-4]|uniref:flagellar motor protein MotB n=1 Tax=Yoonia sp. 208BN28-4 TaxID=3126505 RepID=UPI0030AED77E
MSAQTNAPIIIKRKKVIAGGGHHGGAWKVAYADFVTAMMAFFMLMWLLNATTEQQRKGIADYFSPTVPVFRVSGGGDDMFGGDSVFTQQNMSQTGQGASAMQAGRAAGIGQNPEDAAAEAAFVAAVNDIEDELLGRGGESALSEQALRHIITRVTDEGLIIEIFDLPGATLFEDGSDTPNPVTQEIATMLAEVLQLVENPLAVSGYIAALPVVVRENTAWDLSMSRAIRMRMMLESGGYNPQDIQRITGFADRVPAASDPAAIRNNRIEITVLRTP